jgi:hypothetical protein
MLTSDQIDVLRGLSGQVVDPVVEFLIRDIARRIAAAGQVTSTAAYQIWRAQNLGVSQKKVMAQVRKLLGASQDEMEALLERSAELGHGYDLARFPTAEAVPFAENAGLQQILDATVQMTREDMSNVTQTMGFVTYDGKCEELTRAYEKSCDFAFQKVVTGAQSYTEAIRDAVRGLAEKGIRTIDYDSGVHTSLEAAVRRNIMGVLGLMQEQISQRNHDDLGCDGWEISAHNASAPDHEPIQGKQYSDAAYTRLNNSLVRRIGTLNCGHAASPIILGVNAPQYTEAELEEMRRANEEGVTVEGKHYTLYEATQRQRSLERSMRKQKRRILIDESTGDKEKLQWDQIRLVRTREEYHRFSEAAGLREQWERAEAAGFTRKHGKAATAAYKQSQMKSSQVSKAHADGDIKIGWPPKGASISNEHYRELRTYAEGKGVFLQGYKNSDVDVSLTREVVDSAERLFAKYPELRGTTKRPFTLALDRHMKSADFAEVREGAPHIVRLNADAYRSKSALQVEYGKLADEGWFVKGTTYQSVIYHEIGHMVADVYGIDGLAVMKDVLGTDSAAETLLWCKNNLSEYSFKSDGSEIISEMFSAFYGINNPPQEVVDFMARCDKMILDRRGEA